MARLCTLFIAPFLLALLSLTSSDTVSAAKDCGGLNQKSCWHVDPKKWCNGNLKYKPTGVPGQGRCVKPEPKKENKKKDCGALNQKSCWHVDPTKWCQSGLKYAGTGKPGEGRCVKPGTDTTPNCGGLNQKSCWNLNSDRWCDNGLHFFSTGKPGEGKCIKPGSDPTPDCGGLNQKSCWNANPEGWCDKGLHFFSTGKPGEGKCIKPGSDPTPDCGGVNQKSCWNANPEGWCDKGLHFFSTGKPGDGKCIKPGSDPTPDCGGLNQKSCWNANPAGWCDKGLKYFGSGAPGQGTCIIPGSDPTPHCGGDGQKSCWNVLPKHWCDDGNSYSPGIVPNEGTCHRKFSKEEYKAAAQGMYNTVKRLGFENPIFQLRTCLLRPDNLEKLKDAMTGRSENGVNGLLSICGVSPEQIKQYGQSALGYMPKTLKIGLSGGLVAGIGADAAITYAIPLEPRPDGRYLITNGLKAGSGAAVGVDVTVGLTGDAMPTKHWVSEKGKSINFSAKALGSVSISIDFPERGITPGGFTVGAGAGIGAEVWTISYTRDQYLYNF